MDPVGTQCLRMGSFFSGMLGGGDICREPEFELSVTSRVIVIPKVEEVLMFTAGGNRTNIRVLVMDVILRHFVIASFCVPPCQCLSQGSLQWGSCSFPWETHFTYLSP